MNEPLESTHEDPAWYSEYRKQFDRAEAAEARLAENNRLALADQAAYVKRITELQAQLAETEAENEKLEAFARDVAGHTFKYETMIARAHAVLPQTEEPDVHRHGWIHGWFHGPPAQTEETE